MPKTLYLLSVIHFQQNHVGFPSFQPSQFFVEQSPIPSGWFCKNKLEWHLHVHFCSKPAILSHINADLT